MPSVAAHPQAIKDYLVEECAQGRILGPLCADAVLGVQVSRFGLIPKKTPNEWRLIVDLSSPEGSSVNNGIYSKLCSLQYISVEDALRDIQALGRGTLMAKVDIKKAYRMVPVHPADRPLLGMQWGGHLFLDAALPFGLRSAPKIFTAVADAAEWMACAEGTGLRSAPKIFTAVADAAEWMACAEGVPYIQHYLDDFIILGHPGSPECQQSVDRLLGLFDRLGIPVAPDKPEGPPTTLTFLGIKIDTMALEVRLPAAKLCTLQEMVQEWQGRKSCSRSDLESLLGSLVHACCVVKEGKTFLRRLFELLSVAKRAHHHLRLNAGALSDLCWWQAFLIPLNQASFARPFMRQPPQFTIATDALGAIGCGAIWSPYWFQLQWATVRRTWEVIASHSKSSFP